MVLIVLGALATFLLKMCISTAMRRLDSNVGESLEQYLVRSLMAVREGGASAELEFDGVVFVISPAMSVSQAAAAWKSARRLHDMRSA